MAQMHSYPSNVCYECARQARGEMPAGVTASMHKGRCDVCRKDAIVADPRDYGWPTFKGCTPPTGEKRWKS